ncbi:tenm3, partial [Symbiodinium necroappetens]
TFRREMAWWMSSLDSASTMKYNLAARWLLRQSGIVRQRGEEFSPEDLAFQPAQEFVDPETGETFEVSPADPFFGLNKLLKALESMNGQSTLDKRGELRTAFYIHMMRKAGERVSDYSSRFRTAIADLKAEGVVLPDPEVGWFYKEKLGLDGLRKQLLETALAGAEDYHQIEAECLRLFRDLHTQDPLFRKADRAQGRLTVRRMFGSAAGSSAASSSTAPPASSSYGGASSRRSTLSSVPSSAGQLGRPRFPQRQVHATETAGDEGGLLEEEADFEGDGALDEPTGEHEERTLEEVLQTEVENLAEEIAQAEEEGVDPMALETLENGIEASAEALVSMREARVKLAEIRKDRGFRGPLAAGGASAGKGRGKGNPSIAAKKASGKHVCFDCGLSGHWAGDEACQKPGQGLGRAKGKPGPPKHVRLVEAIPENEVSHTESIPPAPNEVLTALSSTSSSATLSLDQAFRLSTERAVPASSDREALAAQTAGADKSLVGALDSACNRTCAGQSWIDNYIATLASAPKYIQELVLIWISAVDVPSLGLLLGRDVLDALGGVLDFADRTLLCRAFERTAVLTQLSAGHLALPLLPDDWPQVVKPKWRRLGTDGVLETMLCCRSWAKHLMRGRSSGARVSMESRAHNHHLTEASLVLGRTAFEYNSVLLTLAQEMAKPVPIASGGDFLDKVLGQWRRMILRVVTRWNWAKDGLRLALVKRPDLRFLPFPWPSVSSVAQWRAQAATMVANGSFPHRWVETATWSASTLSAMTWFRGRFGIRFAFLEDPLLQGMLAVTSSKGRASRVRASMLKEAQEEAAKEADRMEAARSLIGPRGGLPTLKADLLRLAALLHVDVSEKDKVEDLKAKVKPMVELIKGSGSSTKAAAATSGAGSSTFSSSPSPLASKTFPRSSARLTSATAAPTSGPMASTAPMVTLAAGNIENHRNVPTVPDSQAVTMSAFTSFMETMDRRYQGMLEQANQQQQAMLSQVLQHVMQMQGTTASLDTEMEDGWDQVPQPLPDEEEADPRMNQAGQLVTQAWDRHRREQLLLSCSRRRVYDAMLADHFLDYKRAQHEVFVMEIPLVVAEAVGAVDKISQCARVRGHTAAGPWTSEAGWDLLHRDARLRALRALRHDRPYFLVLTAPTPSWVPKARLNYSNDQLRPHRLADLTLLNFVARLAREQIKGGRLFVFRLPAASAAWRAPALRRLRQRAGVFCFSLAGHRLLTSSQAVVSQFLDKDAVRASSTTASGFGKYLVQAFEREFDFESRLFGRAAAESSCYLTTSVPGSVDLCYDVLYHDTLAAEGANPAEPEGLEFTMEKEDDSDGDLDLEPFKGEITPAVRQAVRRVHEATGHRPPKRLARALLLSGAPAAAVQAARELKCDVCAERRAPRSRRVGTLPPPRFVGEQVHIDLLVLAALL